MPTECSADLFEFAPVEGREVVAGFDGGAISSDAGALLLGATDRAIGMMDRFASCFHDERRQDLIEHEIVTLVGQRVFGIALGYEDINDHDELRHDPLMAVLAGKLKARRKECAPVAGKSTLNRLELSRLEPTRYHKISHNPIAIKRLLVDLFLEAHDRAPSEVILDLDATDDPVHGNQEGRFFHGYYDCYCYLPLYVFCGRHLLAAKLRPASMDAAAGAVEEVTRLVAHIRRRWPHARILVRADSGFAREELMAWCEANGVHFLFGLAQNERLVANIAAELARAEVRSRLQGVHVDDAPQLEPHAQGRRQGRVHQWRGQSALCRHLVEARRVQAKISLRKGLLRPRRDGEPDQGVPARPLRRSHLDRHDARQPVAPVVRFDGLRAALRLAPDRARSHAICQSKLRHHSSQATQDRRARAHQRPPRQDRDVVELSRSPCLGLRSRPSQRRGKRTRLARLTRAAATRNNCGIIPMPTETTSSFPESPSSSRVVRRHKVARLQKTKQIVAQTCSIVQR
jgi:DDE family transposase